MATGTVALSIENDAVGMGGTANLAIWDKQFAAGGRSELLVTAAEVAGR